jgi:hypothetical protein
MGFLDKVIGGGAKVKRFCLTDIGQEKVENAVGDESKARYIIMSDLAEHGSSTIHEISERKGLEEHRVKNICDALLREQCLRTVKES